MCVCVRVGWGERMNTTLHVYAAVIFFPILCFLSTHTGEWRRRETGTSTAESLQDPEPSMGYPCSAHQPLRQAKSSSQEQVKLCFKLIYWTPRPLSFPHALWLLITSFTDETRDVRSWVILISVHPAPEWSPSQRRVLPIHVECIVISEQRQHLSV